VLFARGTARVDWSVAMSDIVPGSFVVHAKLPELGNGEVMSVGKGATRVRFASGERNFATDIVSQHLSVVIEGPRPQPVAKAAKASRKAPASRPAVK
jgi:hypothetical protein